jgi:hypothetical protein
LLPDSPCIDTGDNSAIPESVLTDLEGNPRVTNSTVDLGAYEKLPPSNIYYVNAISGDDNNDGLTLETAFATIQKGIDTAVDGKTIMVYPGIYQEEINFLGKRIKVYGNSFKIPLSRKYRLFQHLATGKYCINRRYCIFWL